MSVDARTAESTDLDRPTVARGRCLDLLTALFASAVIISGLIAPRLISLGEVVLPASALLFPVTYIFGDILTEVYGYRRARRVIWIGLLCNVLAAVVFGVVAQMPAPSGYRDVAAFETVLAQVPLITCAGWIAFFLGENANSISLSILKKLTMGRMLWLRTISSTLVGELVDTVVFLGLAFRSVMGTDALIDMMLSLYLWKVAVEILFTPATYWIVGRVKRFEGLDTYDYGVKYNPFRLRADG